MSEIPTGIQLYNVRNSCKEDFKGTLKTLADIGYKAVEFAWNYGDMEPKELAAFLKDTGLSTCGQHVSTEQILDSSSKVYAYADALDCKYITTSLASEVEKDWQAVIELVKKCGKTAFAQEKVFTYHNHAAEFKKFDNEYALDMLYAQTDPIAVQCELDAYWIKKGGADPVAYIRKYAGRVAQVHIKDMDKNDGSFTEIGEGIIDIAGIVSAAQDVNAQWLIYEQDICKVSEIESARISFENLKKYL